MVSPCVVSEGAIVCRQGPGRPLPVRRSLPSAGDIPSSLHATPPSRSRAHRDGRRRRARVVGAVAGPRLIVRRLLRVLRPHECAEGRDRRRRTAALRQGPRRRRVRAQAGALPQLDSVRSALASPCMVTGGVSAPGSAGLRDEVDGGLVVVANAQGVAVLFAGHPYGGDRAQPRGPGGGR